MPSNLMHYKALYRPIQPTVNASSIDIKYWEIDPCNTLENFVYCYWQLETARPLASDYQYRVVADGCIDIFVDLHDEKKFLVMGFHKKYAEFSLGKQFNYIGIRFFPSIFPQLFNVSANLLSNKVQHFEPIDPQFSKVLSAEPNNTLTLDEMKRVFDKHLEEKIEQTMVFKDSRFLMALKKLLESNGTLETETDLDTGISPRQLRRIFNHYIGTTPKSFSKVLRFQSVLKAKMSTHDQQNSAIYLDNGYYDQAHFIKDFKNYYGVTPSQAFD